MNFGAKIRILTKKNFSTKKPSDYHMDQLVKEGRDQFKKLIERGINIPVALL